MLRIAADYERLDERAATHPGRITGAPKGFVGDGRVVKREVEEGGAKRSGDDSEEQDHDLWPQG